MTFICLIPGKSCTWAIFVNTNVQYIAEEYMSIVYRYMFYHFVNNVTNVKKTVNISGYKCFVMYSLSLSLSLKHCNVFLTPCIVTYFPPTLSLCLVMYPPLLSPFLSQCIRMYPLPFSLNTLYCIPLLPRLSLFLL